jgi:hypothetical protein
MIDVIIYDKKPYDILTIVHELKNTGFVQGVDFDFEYHKPTYNDWSAGSVYNRHTIFTFYKDELATYFKLKYE